MRTTRRADRRLAALALTAAMMATVAACGAEGADDPAAGDASTSTATSPSESPGESSEPTATSPGGRYAELAGTWRSTNDGEWVLHLKADRTFIQDFAGAKDMREGKFRLNGDKIVLKGGDGLIDRGTYDGKRLRVRDYVFTRKQ